MRALLLSLCWSSCVVHGFGPRAALPSKGSRRGAGVQHMFSGIVEDVGRVAALRERDEMLLWDGSRGQGYELEVFSPVAVDGAELGCSIAINGVCLTATAIDEAENTVTFGLSPETLRLSNLRSLQSSQPVNVERALPTESRNSGHFVQGHVDNCGVIVKAWKEGDSLWLKIAAPDDLMRYIVPKGFIAVDGTSLTVCETASAAMASSVVARDEPAEGVGVYGSSALPDGHGWFTLMLVAYTQSKIILPSKAVEGATESDRQVNLEVDVLAKYVERGLQGVLDRMEKLEAQVQKLAPKD